MISLLTRTSFASHLPPLRLLRYVIIQLQHSNIIINFLINIFNVKQGAYKNKKLPAYHATLPAFEVKKRAMMVRILIIYIQLSYLELFKILFIPIYRLLLLRMLLILLSLISKSLVSNWRALKVLVFLRLLLSMRCTRDSLTSLRKLKRRLRTTNGPNKWINLLWLPYVV